MTQSTAKSATGFLVGVSEIYSKAKRCYYQGRKFGKGDARIIDREIMKAFAGSDAHFDKVFNDTAVKYPGYFQSSGARCYAADLLEEMLAQYERTSDHKKLERAVDFGCYVMLSSLSRGSVMPWGEGGLWADSLTSPVSYVEDYSAQKVAGALLGAVSKSGDEALLDKTARAVCDTFLCINRSVGASWTTTSYLEDLSRNVGKPNLFADVFGQDGSSAYYISGPIGAGLCKDGRIAVARLDTVLLERETDVIKFYALDVCGPQYRLLEAAANQFGAGQKETEEYQSFCRKATTTLEQKNAPKLEDAFCQRFRSEFIGDRGVHARASLMNNGTQHKAASLHK